MDYSDARQRFAIRLRSLRQDKHLTQEQLAEQVGKSTEHISFLERGERSPSFEIIIDLASALEVSIGFLLDIDRSASTGLTR